AYHHTMLQQIRHDIEDVKTEMSEIEAEHRKEVEGRNSQEREDELRRTLKFDVGYVHAKLRLRELEMKRTETEAVMEFHRYIVREKLAALRAAGDSISLPSANMSI